MSALRGKKLDPSGAKKGVQTGKSQFSGKQSEWAMMNKSKPAAKKTK